MRTDDERSRLESCDTEPIHIPGSIQPHGAMLVVDPRTFHIRFASANLGDVTGIARDTFHDLAAADVIGDAALHDLRNAAARSGSTGAAGIVMGLAVAGTSRRFDAMIHTYKGNCIIELEPVQAAEGAAESALDTTRQMIGRIAAESDPDRLFSMGARLVQAMLGYDRVMIYRFLHNGAGRVVAEARSPNLGSFMGQHFPASDIPAQARRLYLENPIRMISSASYAPVPLEPPLAPGEAPVDMSHAQLRSVSPVHCEYLRNMGVGGSLSVSLIVDGQLWGLITCHHYAAKATPVALRIGAELFGHYFASQIAMTERRRAMAASAKVREELDTLVADFATQGPLALSLPQRLPLLSRMIGSDGAALLIDGTWARWGNAPTQEQCIRLAAHVGRLADRDLWHTQELRSVLPDIDPPMAGAMAIPMSQLHDDTLFLFRNEEAYNVEWAGEPLKFLTETPAGRRLSPRGSFETWREDVRGRSLPWDETDIVIAKAMRTWLRDVILRQNEASAEEQARIEQRRRILNDELNHRVKNVIALVRSIAMQTGDSADTVEDYLTRLEGRLQALATAHDQSLGDRGGGLGELVETEIGLHRTLQGPSDIQVSGPALRLTDKAFAVVAMAMHEMTTNAVKYGALSVTDGRLRVSWRIGAAGDLVLVWRESAGPRVAVPRSTGFGTKLIRSSVEYDLQGRATLTYDPAGLSAEFVIPARFILPGGEPQAPPSVDPDTPDRLSGLNVLVVEDEGLIAMDVENTLRKLGVADVRLAGTAADALAILDGFTPDLAVLDFNLGDGTSEGVARHLIDQRLPFLFMTGYSDRVMLPTDLRSVPVVRKPINAATISLQAAAARDAVAVDGTPAEEPGID